MGPQLFILLVGCAYLINLLQIRAFYRTTYNDVFAIPITIAFLFFILLDLGRVVLVSRGQNEGERNIIKFTWGPELTFALLIFVYILLFSLLPFILLNFIFLLLAPAVLFLSVPGREEKVWRMVLTWRWGIVALLYSVVLYVIFKIILNVPL